jgi:hypothetical protein
MSRTWYMMTDNGVTHSKALIEMGAVYLEMQSGAVTVDEDLIHMRQEILDHQPSIIRAADRNDEVESLREDGHEAGHAVPYHADPQVDQCQETEIDPSREVDVDPACEMAQVITTMITRGMTV